MNLGRLAAQHSKAFPGGNALDRAQFIANALSALNAPAALAQDAIPLSLKRSNDVPGFNMQPASGIPRGSRSPNDNGRDRRPGRDQMPPTSNLSTQGAFPQELDQGEMDCDDVADLIEICLKKFADDPDQFNRFVGRISNLLPGIEHINSGLGDRDLAQRRTAQDAALPSGSSTSSFLRRFPDAARIKFAGHGRY